VAKADHGFSEAPELETIISLQQKFELESRSQKVKSRSRIKFQPFLTNSVVEVQASTTSLIKLAANLKSRSGPGAMEDAEVIPSSTRVTKMYLPILGHSSISWCLPFFRDLYRDCHAHRIHYCYSCKNRCRC